MSEPSNIIPAFKEEARLKRKIRAHLNALGFEKDDAGCLMASSEDKAVYRKFHSSQRQEKLDRNAVFLEKAWPIYHQFFANGADVNPNEIKPRIELVEPETWQSECFRLAALTWSVPVSQGYGRRMRFLVWDDSNDKLIGIIGLTDPVFNLRARDQLIGWSSDDRKARLTFMMDAHVLGALPPYNYLLGGKLMSCLLKTTEIRDLFAKKYTGSVGIISQESKSAKLVAITTSSSLGRSSIYNRLKLNGTHYFRSIGYTQGFGHFQISQEIFDEIREMLADAGHKYAKGYKFGSGPNWRMRTIRAGLSHLGLNPNLLKHSLKREVFLCSLASNFDEILRGTTTRANWRELKSAADVSEEAVARWMIPRSERQEQWKVWSRTTILDTIRGQPQKLPNSQHAACL